MKKVVFSIFITILFFSCVDTSESSVTEEKLATAPTFEIAPPIEEAVPPEEVFSIDPTKDTTLISENGSFVSVPANSFVDSKGQVVDTKVNVEFTEYQNPADILFSGIPMSYLEGIDTMTFQSAGMCKIDATIKGKKLKIAEGKSLEVGLRNRAQDADYNLYYFDEAAGEWSEKEKEMVVIEKPIPNKPLSVLTVDSNRIMHINVNYEAESKTFLSWDDSKFYLLPGQNLKYNDRTDIYWYSMSLQETVDPDVYALSLNGASGGKQFLEAAMVQPLIDPNNQEAEERAFQNRMRDYVRALRDEGIKYEKSKKESEEILAEIEEKREKLRIEDSIRIADEEAAMQLRTDVMRTFEVAQLGIYNCDRFYQREIVEKKRFHFQSEGKDVVFNQAKLCSPGDNAVLSLFPNGNKYEVDFSKGKFYFVGIKGKELYCKEVNLSTPNGKMEIEKSSIEELNGVLGVCI